MIYYVEMFNQAIKEFDKDYDGKNKKKSIKTKILNPYKK